MSAQPRWEDRGQDDLLALVAMGNVATDTAEREWSEYVAALQAVALVSGGVVSPNRLRVQTRYVVAPRRIGAFCNRALAQRLIEWRGEWEVSDDREGRNAGRPAKVYHWLGGAS